MKHARRTSRHLGSTTTAAAVLVAAAVLASVACAQPSQTVSVKLSAMTLGAQGTTPPTGAVGGVRSPMEVGSTLNLMIDASASSAGLASVHVSIGANSASMSLCPAPGAAGGELSGACPESVSEVPLSINVGGAGSHVLHVTVTDAAGNVGTIVEQTIEVLAPVPPGSNTLTIGISGSRRGPLGESLSEEPARQESLAYKEQHPPPVCPSPMLAMRLTSRPLGHTRRHVPMLRRGRRYLFAGSLTCLHARRRVSAPEGTTVRVLYKRHRCAHGHQTCRVRLRQRTILVHKGRLRVRLRILFRGTITFSYRPSYGESVQVRLQVTARRRHRRGGCPRQRHVGMCRSAGRRR